MSEIDTRPAPSRGRSSTRGGRSGIGRGGPRGGHRQANGATDDIPEPSFEDQGELGELKSQYSSQLSLLKDVFPDWSDVDLVMALQETDGDLPTTIDRITEGHVSQFSEIKKPKDRARSKAKETGAVDYATSAVRGGRGRGGFEGTRGGRGRGDRGRGGARGGRGGAIATNGAPRDTGAVSVPTTESTAYDSAPAAEPATSAWESASAAKPETANQGEWGDVITSESTPATASEGAKSSLIPEGAPKKTWASMFALPKPSFMSAPAPTPVAAQQPIVPGPVPEELAQPSASFVAQTFPDEHEEQELKEQEPVVPSLALGTPLEPEPETQPQPIVPEIEQPKGVTETILAPPQDPLTEDNLENLPDSSHPPATHTAASTVGSLDPRTVTPLAAPGQLAPIGRPPLGGYASSAYRAAGLAGRSASYQRRVLDQQEAVVMPGHNAVDRATVQFGSMGLNGDNEGLDVDDEREEPETRTQPPQQSPPGQPRASLPPAPIQAPQHDVGLPESLPTPKQAPGLPPVSQQQQQHHQQPYGMHQESAQSTGAPQSLSQDSMSSQAYNQYGRFGQSEAAAPAQKSYDPFSHQTPSSSFDQYSSHQSQPAAQQQGYGGFSSAPSDYSQYYTADQQRNAYQSYYGSSYGQQNAQPAQQDSGVSQQRTTSSIGAGSTESPYASIQGAQQQSHSRYGDTQGSGQNTPQPFAGGQPQQQQQHSAGQQQQMQQQYHQAQQQYNSAYPYGHPYYQSPYQTAYQNQFGYQGGYGGPSYSNKGGMHGQPQGYGMNAPSSYDSSSSPATGGFGQQSSMQSRESGLSGGLGDYGRTSSTQPSGLGSGSFGSDPFARSQSGYQGQSQGYGQGQSQGYGQGQTQGYGQQQSAPAEELKPFGESKGTGPSPAVGQPGRPGSAANSIGNQSQASLPPPQGHQQQQQQQQQQQGFGAYPGFNQGSQYGGGLGGLGVHQGQGQGGYSQYGAGFGNQYSQYGRGGWGGNYGH